MAKIADPFGMYSDSIGKEVPSLGPFRNFQPKLAGPRGRFGGIVSGAYKAGKFLWKNYRKHPRAANIGIGAGVARVVAPNNKYGKTYRTIYGSNYRKRSYRSKDNCPRHCTCKHKQRYRSKNRRYY